MSRINFGKYNAEHPELKHAWVQLNNWFSKHKEITTVNSVALSRALREVPPEKLAAAIFYLVNDGQLEQLYQFITPQGDLVGDPFFDPLEPWPDYVENAFGNSLSVNDLELVPIWSVPPENNLPQEGNWRSS